MKTTLLIFGYVLEVISVWIKWKSFKKSQPNKKKESKCNCQLIKGRFNPPKNNN